MGRLRRRKGVNSLVRKRVSRFTLRPPSTDFLSLNGNYFHKRLLLKKLQTKKIYFLLFARTVGLVREKGECICVCMCDFLWVWDVRGLCHFTGFIIF